MSIALPPINVASAVVGQTFDLQLGIMDLQQPPVDPANYPILQILNESGCGFQFLTHMENHSGYIAAGGWRNIAVAPGEPHVHFTVVYIMNQPPVSQILATYYYAGETPDEVGVLGNSPIAGSQNVSGQTLTNETNNAGQEVIDIGTVAHQKNIDIFNDHFVWSVEQSGVVHQVLKGQSSGNPLQIGAAADISEVLGTLLLDKSLQIGITPVTVAGGTSGTASMIQLTIGTFKLVFIEFVNFQTGASAQNLVIPAPYTKEAELLAGDVPNFSLLHSSVAQTFDAVTQLASTGGTVTPITVIHVSTFGHCTTPFDTVQFAASGATTHAGNMLIWGS
jgi:hypothetical protein